MRLATAACNQKFRNVRFATAACARMYEIYVSLQFRAIDTPNGREGSSSKIKMCVSPKRRAIKNFETHVSLQQRAQKCMKQVSDIRRSLRHTKIIVLPQFLKVRRPRSDERVRGHTDKFAFHHSFECPTSTK